MGVVVAWFGRGAVSVDASAGDALDRAALAPATADALDVIDDLVEAFDEHPDPNVRDAVHELLRAVDVVHRQPLRALGALLQGAGLTGRALADPHVALLFQLYDLGEGGDRRRADRVLDHVRPYIESHGGQLDVVDAQGGVVSVRLSGACSGCQGSTATLRHVVEEALRAELDDFVRLEVVEPPRPTPNLIPVNKIERVARPRLGWRPVLAVAELGEGELRTIEVDSAAVLLADVGGEVYAYRSACPGTPMPLDAATVDGDVLVCPWHGCRFSLRGGRRLDRDGPALETMPVAVADGEVRVGVVDAA